MTGLPASAIALFLLTGLIFLGVAERVLDRMRLTDRQALAIIGAMVVGSFIPSIPVTRTLFLDLGGAVVPALVAAYLIATAGSTKEKVRGSLSPIITGLILFSLDRVMTPEPGTRPMLINIDPVWLPGVVAAIVGYLSGRSRRSAFIGATLGVVVSDIGTAILNSLAARQDTVIIIGGAGAVDAIIIGGVLAVVLAELFGETYELVSGGPSKNRPPELLRGLRNEDNREGAGLIKTSLRSSITSRVLTVVVAIGVLALGDRLGAVAIGEPTEAGVYHILDRSGAMVASMGRSLFRGDEYLTENNDLYYVYRVKGSYAWGQHKGRVDIGRLLTEMEDDIPVQISAVRADPRAPEAVVPAQVPGSIVIYHSHNDESYVPTQGVSNLHRGPGGIHRVGDAFAESLRRHGFNVVKSDALHYPHDAGAYRRSRRTALKLMLQRPAALFDVHRDAAPLQYYTLRLGDTIYAKVRFVIGRQNPNMTVNRRFAMAIKAVSDRTYPGLVAGILMGRGAYNQDLYPTAALLEVGSHNNSEESAVRSARALGEIVADYFGIR